MPHVIVKMYAGRSEELKQKIAQAIVDDLKSVAGCKDESISVAIEDVLPEAWMETVYAEEIAPKLDSLYKKPGY